MTQSSQIIRLKLGFHCGTFADCHIMESYDSFVYHLEMADVFSDGRWPEEMIRHLVYAQRLAILLMNHLYSLPIDSPSHSEHP